MIQGDLPRDLVSTEESRFDLLEEALQLVELGDEAETKDEQPEVSIFITFLFVFLRLGKKKLTFFPKFSFKYTKQSIFETRKFHLNL